MIAAGTRKSLWGSLKSLVGMGEGSPAAMEASVVAAVESLPPIQEAVPSNYVIGAGDVIGISVWRDDALTKSVVVLPDGKFDFPLVGEVVAGGKTVAQLKEELEKKLSRYISDAQLSVDVKQSNSMLVYVIGRVNSPGRHVLLARTNVLQALAMAGGLNPFASKNDIRIFRNDGGATKMYSFAYGEVVEGKRLESNIELMRGDVIVVP
ncbi:polysaccharide biosynthesis/export family protein [Geobacter pickeringii]|uniref:polysaccharide biosynthesis/export family protein n=1 Tax=Geobacter pickeringii TaxID=345632 RepID=UPI001F0267B4|nr:polysaccharide biosynthesis/export family protein [Geobacter pickeringii]